MATVSYILCTDSCCDISEKNGLILFIFGSVIKYHVLLLHVKYYLAVSHILAIISIFLLHFMVLISHKRTVNCVHIWYSNQPQ